MIHGAGLNVPAPLIQLEAADFARTLAPKVRGLDHLLDRLESNALRFVVGFGSVIAQLGLPGEADYAWANERMARRVEDFAERHQETRCLALEWSIWSGVGIIFIALIGLVVFGQRLDLPAVLGLGMIVAGILVIHLFSGSTTHS